MPQRSYDHNRRLQRPRQSVNQRPHRYAKKKKQKRRGCFFWALLVAVILAVVGGRFAYAKIMSAKKAADSIFQSSNIKKARNVASALKKGRPISVLLMGTDTGALGRNFKGRTDTMMIAVLNPQKKTMTVVSLPRDTKVTIPGYESMTPSKLNSAYFYGRSGTAVKTVQKYLNVPIDFYATINMGGLEKLIDSVGGIDVTPELTFTYDNQSFVKGQKTHMNGARALAYVRMRHDDPLGDYGRQTRQRQVLTKLAFKSSQLTSLISQTFLSTVSNQMVTDLSFNDLLVVGSKYRVATHNMVTDHLAGQSTMVDGQSFEVPTTTEKQRITNLLRKALGLKKATTGSTGLFNDDDDASDSDYDSSYSYTTTNDYSTDTNGYDSNTTSDYNNQNNY